MVGCLWEDSCARQVSVAVDSTLIRPLEVIHSVLERVWLHVPVHQVRHRRMFEVRRKDQRGAANTLQHLVAKELGRREHETFWGVAWISICPSWEADKSEWLFLQSGGRGGGGYGAAGVVDYRSSPNSEAGPPSNTVLT